MADRQLGRRNDRQTANAKQPDQYRIWVARTLNAAAYSPDGHILYVAGGGKARQIGVAVSPADAVLCARWVPETRGKLGLVVTSVVKDSPAAKAGVQVNDILLRIADQDLSTVRDSTTAVQKAKPESAATLFLAEEMLHLRIHLPVDKRARTAKLSCAG